jgi:hypothetical protein
LSTSHAVPPEEKLSLGRQLLRRAVNERSRSAAAEGAVATELVVLCECGRPRCAERFAVSAATYDEVRRFPTHFAVRTGHEAAEAERLVAEHDGFRIVEKYGAPGLAAIGAQRRRLRLVTFPRS